MAEQRAQRAACGRVPVSVRLLLCIPLVAGGLVVGVAGAAVRDGDDSKSSVDIASARAAFDRSNDRVAHIFRFHEGISARDFRNEISEHGPPGTLCVNIWTSRTPWEGAPNFDVCVTADRSRRHLIASVTRIGRHGSVHRAGRASAQLTTRRRMVVRFDPDLIRRPAAYRWSAQVTTFARGCTRRGCLDFAPRRGRSQRIELS